MSACNVCLKDVGFVDNPIVFCDGANCNVAVHQACYGIDIVPEGDWYCRPCEKAQCILCPKEGGALKMTDKGGWAHVICGLYIPEVGFGHELSSLADWTLEPIGITWAPQRVFKSKCYICLEKQPENASLGACMTCNKEGCSETFHVTCAQDIGLLCEEAGKMDNVKYCG